MCFVAFFICFYWLIYTKITIHKLLIINYLEAYFTVRFK
jgi:hypothetical protein